MHITHFDAAPPYSAPGHFDMYCLRLQGKEAGPSTQMWMGMSQILPGGRTTLEPSPMEKLYFVLEGYVRFTSQLPGQASEVQMLGPNDSCRFAPGEARQLENTGQRPAMVLLVMATAAP
jgi:mannose-6-phosphate isomerase-like protein (cupin superfamily)